MKKDSSIKLSLQIIIFNLLLVSILTAAGIFLSNQQVSLFNQNIMNLLQKDEGLSNSSLFVRKFADLENENRISCTQVYDAAKKISFYDSSYKDDCVSDHFFLSKIRSKFSVVTLSGQHYLIEYTYLNTLNFSLIIFLLKITVILSVNFLILYLKKKNELDELKRIQEEQFSEIAKQVSHDIRSPLSALSIITERAHDLPQDQRDLLRLAANRIQDIANNLLKRSKFQDPKESASLKSTKMETSADSHIENEVLLALNPIIQEIIQLKKIELEAKDTIKIQYLISDENQNLKSKFIATDIKNILSNLINNSADAIDKNGFVSISLEKEDDNLLLEIRDNGKGIPKDLLPQLMQEGASFGKANGNGLGLYHAKKSIESWGGHIQIRSTVGVGTTVSIKLPIAN